jgi:signal transduction histidine kinase
MDFFHDFALDARGDPTAQALQQAERLLACWQQALGHELPNQLVGINGLAGVLGEMLDGKLDPEEAACLQRLRNLAQSCGDLLRSLAEVGRLCRDLRAVEEVDIREVAQEAAAEVHLLSSGVVIEYDFQGELPFVKVSRRALYQVLLQLLHNAARAALPSRPLSIQVGARPYLAGLEFWIADNGRGLAEDCPENVFAPSFGPREGTGHGLGLFVVHQLVAGWRGALRVQSEPGQGTRFTVRVPGRQD